MFLTTSAPVFYRFCSTGGAALCPAGGARPPPAGLLGRPARNFVQMALTLPQKVCYNMARGAAPHHVRGWRNRQTRTFEGRVVIPCEFKSRSSHQLIAGSMLPAMSFFFLCQSAARALRPPLAAGRVLCYPVRGLVRPFVPPCGHAAPGRCFFAAARRKGRCGAQRGNICGKTGKRPWARRHWQAGAAHCRAQHAGAVCQRAVQHCRPHVHRQHPRGGRRCPCGRGRVRPGGYHGGQRGLSDWRGRRAADEH